MVRTTKSFINNQFMARASGGVVLLTSTAASPTNYATGSAGVALLPNATAWTTVCDRNAKKNFKPVDTVAVLDKLASIPIRTMELQMGKGRRRAEHRPDGAGFHRRVLSRPR